jgi:hypothetical protein|tara:strand:+ start:302 stop:475 length:174 start_codon:yes stop_codon:yes gene_type:complete
MKVGDLVKRRGWTPTSVGVITAIMCEDEYRVLDVVVHVGDKREEWEADETEVISENR